MEKKFLNCQLLTKKIVWNMNNYKGTTTKFQKNENIFDDQIRWEQLKYKIGKYLTLFFHI